MHAGFAGYHLVDDRWPDLSEAGRAARLAMLERHAATVAALDESQLSPDERIDRAILLEQIEKARFGDAAMRDEAWDALTVVYLLGAGLFALLAREYAPWSHRGAAFAGRVETLPAVLQAAIDGLTGLPGRPVSLLHLETALAQLSGVSGPDAGGSRGGAHAGRRGRFPGARHAHRGCRRRTASAAVETFRADLDVQVRPRASGDGRLGEALFAQKLRYTLSSDMTPDQLLQRAWRDHAAVRAEMLRLSRELWPTWLPEVPLPVVEPGDGDAETNLVREVLDAIATEHQQPADLLDWCRDEVARIEAFCRDAGIIGLTDEPLSIIWTPVFLRAYGRAFLDAPGPLDQGLQSHFFITPPADDASAGVDRVLHARGQRPDAPAAVHPRGRPWPLPPGRLVESVVIARPDDLQRRHVRGGLGGLRGAGDDGSGLRRRRSGPAAHPLEDDAARHHQRHP